ncbi:hypothetical protein [Kineosporia sp. R_H_3]|uniref:hypothetical protein n=1 Tax=Kineosporia sp. R_H_3 TaxID=1961848 RepID=UPI001303F74F|nr:hypothetical protein [Kineosporia sp. R_H_3]
MDHLTRGPRILQGRTPLWRIGVREQFPLPGVSAWLLAVGIVLGAGALQALFWSGA